MPGPALESAVFTAANATVGRRLDAYATNDVVNVKNYGAVGDGTADDRAAVQAAIDYAFGAAGSPHGLNFELNKPLFFPPGIYKLGNGTVDGIVFTQVKRGHIYGAVNSKLIIPFNSTNKQIIRTNGMESSLLENMTLELAGTPTGSVALDIDWDGTGSVGLQNNTFRKLEIGGGGSTGGATGVRIANSGNGGAANYFWNVISTIIGTGYHVKGANATGQVFQGICGGSESHICWLVDGGSIATITGISNAGTNVQTDIVINNASTITVQGVRSEASWFLELNASGAKAIIQVARVGSGGHTGTQQNIKMAPGTTLAIDGLVTYAIVATSPGTTPKPIIYKRGGANPDTGAPITFSPSSSDFTFLQNI